MIQSQLLGQFAELNHGFSDREAGNMSVRKAETAEAEREALENRRRFWQQLGIAEREIVLSHQTHEIHVGRAGRAMAGRAGENASPFSSADGLTTDEPNLGLTVFSADCLPIFLYDPVTGQIGTIHAGWRGLAGGIIDQAINQLVMYDTDPADLRVWIGPHIQVCHYDINPAWDTYAEKLAAFGNQPKAIIERNGQQFLDLTSVAVRQLEKHGLLRDYIEIGECTACHPDRYFSYHATLGKGVGIMMGTILRRSEKEQQ